jgi:hypothetical protein
MVDKRSFAGNLTPEVSHNHYVEYCTENYLLVLVKKKLFIITVATRYFVTVAVNKNINKLLCFNGFIMLSS